MRIKKRKHPGMPPSQVEALGRLTPAEFDQINKNLGMPPEKVEALDSESSACRGAPACGGFLHAGTAETRTPLLIGGEIQKATIPVNPLDRPIPSFLTVDDVETAELIVLDRNQNPVIKLGVKPIKGQKVGVDWVSCVFDQTQAWRYYLNSDHLISMKSFEPEEPKEIADFIKDLFVWVLGIGNASTGWKEFENGLNCYKYAAAMPYQAGIVHAGHTSKTVLVTISGQGCLIANAGWETRLQWFLSGVNGWLTRVDLAYDDYEGSIFPVRQMREKAKEGAFTKRRPPKLEVRGQWEQADHQTESDPQKVELRGQWDQSDPNNAGLTLYIGCRSSGKLARIYEKGKQLGMPESPWVRFEVELHSSTFQLTLEMLTSPTKYFAAFYPCCEWIEQGGERCPMEYKVKCAFGSIQHSMDWIRHQAGGHLAYLRQNYGDKELLDLLERKDGIPKALKAVDVLANQCQEFVDQKSVPSACPADEPDFIRAQ